MGTTILTVGIFLLIGLTLFSCTEGSKSVRLRFKFEAGDTYEYRQLTRGIVRAHDLDNDKLLNDEYSEVTMDIDLQVEKILADSTAEIIESKTYSKRMRNMMDSTTSDTVQSEKMEASRLVKYLTPRGGIVDLEFVSDTNRSEIQYLKDYYRQGLPEFPDREIAQGESWTQTTKVILPDGPVDASTTYTIKGFSRERGYDCVIIEYDGVSIIPLIPAVHETYEIVNGTDKIISKGHLCFAYKEGAIISINERWVLDSDRTIVRRQVKEGSEYKVGDTTHMNIGIEYDVDYHVVKMTHPE